MTQRPFPVAILAGGLATRLRPLTQRVPKALLDVQGEPFIAQQLRLLKSAGLKTVVVCSGYLGEMIRDVVGDGSRFGLEVVYSFDGPRLLGTAGALRKARPLLGECFQVLYGDSYLPCDYVMIQNAFARSGRLGMMTVFQNEGQYDSSNVEYSDGKILVYDKKRRTPRMRHIDYGLGVFRAVVLDTVPDGQPYDLADVYSNLLSRGELAAYEVADRFYEIGSRAGLQEMRQFAAMNLKG